MTTKQESMILMDWKKMNNIIYLLLLWIFCPLCPKIFLIEMWYKWDINKNNQKQIKYLITFPLFIIVIFTFIIIIFFIIVIIIITIIIITIILLLIIIITIIIVIVIFFAIFFIMIFDNFFNAFLLRFNILKMSVIYAAFIEKKSMLALIRVIKFLYTRFYIF